MQNESVAHTGRVCSVDVLWLQGIQILLSEAEKTQEHMVAEIKGSATSGTQSLEILHQARSETKD